MDPQNQMCIEVRNRTFVMGRTCQFFLLIYISLKIVHFAKSVKICANEHWWNQRRGFMEHQETYLICQLADSFNEQTDTEMCWVAKGQKYGKPIQFGQVLPNWYR